MKAPAIAEVCDEIRSRRAAADHDDPVQPVALELGALLPFRGAHSHTSL